MPTPKQQAALEIARQTGRKSAMRDVLRVVWEGMNADEKELAALVAERQEAVVKLRDVCAEFGSNDWPDDLHLADVIDKYLGRYLRRVNREIDANQ